MAGVRRDAVHDPALTRHEVGEIPMRRSLLLAVASACVLTSPTLAAETAADLPTENVTAGAAQAAPTDAEIAAARAEHLQRAELNARMDAVLEASKKTLAGLQTMIDASKDAATVRELEGRMAEVKKGTTIDLLKVQATFARENGRIEQANEIDAEIDAILHPKRPAPVAGAAASQRAVVGPVGGAR
jgi:hypothetical protein